MNFAAIDFETATSARDSACSVAVVEIGEGKIVDSYYTLIRPPENRYHWFNMKIHGIRREDTQNARDFAGIWQELKPHLEGRIVVAHNASFDMSVLRACLKDFSLPLPEFSYCDTVAMAKKVWPELENHKLDTVGDFLQIDFHHHNALDDARTCAAIPLAAGKKMREQNLPQLAKKLGLPIRPFRTVRRGTRKK